MHSCPGRGCSRQIGSNELACPRCRRKLPAHLRNAVSNSYRHNDPSTHSGAAVNSIAWLSSMSCSPASSSDMGGYSSGGYDGGSCGGGE